MDATTIGLSTTDDLTGRFLTFWIGDAIYGIELLNVLEIVKVQPIMRVPEVASYIKGIINLRGKIVPVIDVRLKFNYPSTAYDEKTCIIVIDINDMRVGLIVDRVLEVMGIDQKERTPPPNTAGTNQYLNSIANINGRIIMIIDCQKFFASDLGTVDV